MHDSFLRFFGLRENPFNVNPDPRYLLLTPQTQEALRQLSYGIETRKGLILLTGEVGTGKTTLINQMLDWLRHLRTPTAFVFNARLDMGQLFDFMLADFGIHLDAKHESNPLACLNRWLIDRYSAGESPVLFVDEAQGLPSAVLEEIRLLLNLETPREKLLQIVLSGQPELEQKLNRPELRQVQQRITLRCKIAPLAQEETHTYIEHRLRIAGAKGEPTFAAEAMDAVHFYARGIPRVINLLCEHALINAYVDDLRPVPAHVVGTVARDLQFDDAVRFRPAVPSSPATPNQAAIQSILETSRKHAAQAYEMVLRERAHAAAAGVGAHVPDVKSTLSSNSQPAPASPDAKGAFPPASSPEAPASRPDAQRVSEVAAPPEPVASSPAGQSREANTQSDVSSAPARNQISAPPESARRPHQIRAPEQVARRLGRTLTSLSQQTLDRWRTKWRDKCVPVVSPTEWQSMTESLLRYLQDSQSRVQQHWHAHNERRSPSRASLRFSYQLLFGRVPRWRDRCLSVVNPKAWQEITGSLLHWLRRPLYPARRHQPEQGAYKRAPSAQS